MRTFPGIDPLALVLALGTGACSNDGTQDPSAGSSSSPPPPAVPSTRFAYLRDNQGIHILKDHP
ncbi:MAG: hypothetical protein H0T76_07130 [Nannocystis sp.]|nr:hypothetical protein [Nannocystis sp.]MBA3546236.1 hypothetical protein [Nannocystis sp.]